MVPLPEPERVTVHHAASLVAVHGKVDVTVKFVFPGYDHTYWIVGVTEILFTAAA